MQMHEEVLHTALINKKNMAFLYVCHLEMPVAFIHSDRAAATTSARII